MSGCQVIKSNNTWCRNYARKGLTCCWPHRKLENDIPEKEHVVPVVEVVPENNPWPSLEEAQAEIKLFSINTLESIVIYVRAKNGLDLTKREQRLMALTISESIMVIPIEDKAKIAVKKLITEIIKKLADAGYKKEYIKRIVKYHNSI